MFKALEAVTGEDSTDALVRLISGDVQIGIFCAGTLCWQLVAVSDEEPAHCIVDETFDSLAKALTRLHLFLLDEYSITMPSDHYDAINDVLQR